jgi:hypothetical protein
MAKKPKLELRPAEIPSTPELDPKLGFDDAQRSPTGRIVGRRQLDDDSGISELFVVDPGKRPRKTKLKPLCFGRPDLSADGSRALIADSEGVTAISLDDGDRQTKVWTGGAPLHESWMGIVQACFADPEHVLLVTGLHTVLMRWARRDQLEPVSTVKALERCFIAWPLPGGRFLVLQSSSQNFLCAVKGGAVHVLKKASKQKEYLSVSHGRVFVTAPDAPTAEAQNLEELYASL